VTMDKDIPTSSALHSAGRECLPLLNAAHLDIYRENTFRIAGISVDASEREIKKQAGRLKMREELLGQDEDGTAHAYALRPAPSVDQIRAAMQRLKEPEQRLIDEFFWFWPKEFGKSEEDPAIQALQRGDGTTAHGIWSNEAVNPATGYVAIHNLAILYHLVALDWTLEDLKTGVDTEREAKIEAYWRSAFHYWEHVATHDDIWNMIKTRVQALDDPRLTTGFVRRMRASLPEAFDKINAEAALKFAEAGRMDWARKHIDFMNETHQGLDDVEKTSLLVLAPAKRRVQQLTQRGKEESAKDPSEGLNVAERLVASCGAIKHLFDIFHTHAAEHNETLFDEVAEQINLSLVNHGKHTGENSQHIHLLEAALAFASDAQLRELLQKNISIRRKNAHYQKQSPLLEQMLAMRKSKQVASQRLVQMRGLIIPRVKESPAHIDGNSDLHEMCAETLRDIGISAHNADHDFETSLAALQLAAEFAQSDELKLRLSKDEDTILSNKRARQASFVKVLIRNDCIVVNDEHVKDNYTTIPSSTVIGICHGISAHYTNGIRTHLSYLIGVKGLKAEISIECKRMFRSEALARQDYETIVTALHRLIVPGMIQRFVQILMDGESSEMGGYGVCKKGIYLKTGLFGLGGTDLVPWPDVGWSVGNGELSLWARTNHKCKGSMSLQTAWNAVVFGSIHKAMLTATGATAN
jgi:hypothetical protein